MGTETLTSEIDCERVEDLLALQVAGGTLAPDAAKLLAAHLSTCAACAAVAETSAPITDRSGDRAELPAVETSAYALGPEIARGGMGRIRAARDLRIGRPVAVKELLGAGHKSLAARFEREARVTARLQHPGIVPIYEIGTWPDGTPFYSMRLVEGRTLFSAIATCKTLDERLALLPSIIAAASAVAFAHDQRVIHRDLTPSNVMLGAYGETVVIDWGLAKDLTADEDGDAVDVGPYRAEPAAEGLTAAGAVIGTAAYMPPEQATGETVDERGDVYAIGAILYHLLAGVAPYRGASSGEVLEKLRLGPPKPIAVAASAAPRDLLSIVEKAMQRERDERYPSAKQLVDELQRFQTGRIVEAHAYTRSELVRRWVRRHRAAVIGAAVVALVVVVGGAWSLRSILRESERADAERAVALSQRDVATAEQQRATAMTVALLEEQGRQELLAGEYQKALAYLNAALQGGLDTPELRLMLGEAIRRIETPPPVEACPGTVEDFVESSDGQRWVVTCGDTVRGWSVADRKMLFEVPAKAAGLVISRDGALAAVGGEELVVLNTTTGDVRLRKRGGPFNVIGFRDADTELVTASPRALQQWRIHEQGLYRTLVTALDGELRTGISTDGRTVTVASFGGRFEVWDLASSKQLVAHDHAHPISQVDVSHDGKRVVVCGDTHPHLWDVTTRRLRTLGAHGALVFVCTFSPTGNRVFLASLDRTSSIHTIDTDEVVHFTTTRAIAGARFSADGRWVISSDALWTVEIRSASAGHLVDSVEVPSRRVRIGLGDTFTIASRGTLMRRPIHAASSPMFEPPAGEMAIELTNDATRLLTRDRDRAQTLWNTRSGQRLRHPSIRLFVDEPASSQFSGDGSRLIATTKPHELVVISTATGDELARWTVPGHITDFGLDRRGMKAYASAGSKTQVFDVPSRNVLATFVGTTIGPAFSLDGSAIALASDADTIAIYGIGDQQLRASFRATGARNIVGFDATAETLVAVEEQGVWGAGFLGIWDTTTGRRIATGVSSAASFDNERRRLASFGGGRIDIWDLGSVEKLTPPRSRRRKTMLSVTPSRCRAPMASLRRHIITARASQFGALGTGECCCCAVNKRHVSNCGRETASSRMAAARYGSMHTRLLACTAALPSSIFPTSAERLSRSPRSREPSARGASKPADSFRTRVASRAA